MRVHVKICGITGREAALAAVDAGADALGFVFADSPRRVAPETALAISAGLPRRVERVAVFLRPTGAEVAAVLDVFDADVVQADAGTVGHLEGPEWLPVFREGMEEGVEGRRFIYEGPMSGVGETADWSRARLLAPKGRMILAGGLTPANVADAIRTVRPYGVDVSTGVESAPGKKDPERIRAFIEAVRQTEKEMVTR